MDEERLSINWNAVSKHKEKGGLGVGNLELRNKLWLVSDGIFPTRRNFLLPSFVGKSGSHRMGGTRDLDSYCNPQKFISHNLKAFSNLEVSKT